MIAVLLLANNSFKGPKLSYHVVQFPLAPMETLYKHWEQELTSQTNVCVLSGWHLSSISYGNISGGPRQRTHLLYNRWLKMYAEQLIIFCWIMLRPLEFYCCYFPYDKGKKCHFFACTLKSNSFQNVTSVLNFPSPSCPCQPDDRWGVKKIPSCLNSLFKSNLGTLEPKSHWVFPSSSLALWYLA